MVGIGRECGSPKFSPRCRRRSKTPASMRAPKLKGGVFTSPRSQTRGLSSAAIVPNRVYVRCDMRARVPLGLCFRVNLCTFLNKLLAFLFHADLQSRRICDAVRRRVLTNVLRNFHRTEVRAAHRTEVRELRAFLRQGFVVIFA